MRRSRTRARAMAGVVRSAGAAALVLTMALAGGAGAGAAAGGAGAFGARTGDGGAVRSTASLPTLPPGSRAVGATPSAEQLTVDVVLAPRDRAALDSLASAVSDPSSPEFRHFLTPAGFAARFGAAPSTVAAVRDWLSSAGLQVGPTAADGLLVPAHATVGQLSAAFGVGFDRFRLPSGRIARVPTGAPLVPRAVSAAVKGIAGLDNVALATPMLTHGDLSAPSTHLAASQPHAVGPVANPAASGCTSMRSHGFTADQLAGAYSFSSLYTTDEGQGTTIGVYELQSFTASDIVQYEQCYTPTITAAVNAALVDGGPGNSGEEEATLDSEVVVGLAPQATVEVFEGPNAGSGPLDTYAAMVNASTPPQVISTSWGQCEIEMNPATLSGEANLFEQAAVQGQTVVAASGDAGSTDCYLPPFDYNARLTVDDPGSQPWVTDVGGTTLSSLGPPPAQKVWNAGFVTASSGGSTGGGISGLWTMPSWQLGPGVENAYTLSSPCPVASDARDASCREVPDVAFDADPNTGFSVYCSSCGGWVGVGGTSMASPIMAAMVALADQQNGRGLGQIDPALYQAGCLVSPPFSDVTSGNNQVEPPSNPPGSPPGPYYPATSGYDLAAGLGSPVAASLVTDLLHPVDACPRVTGQSTRNGAPAGGTTVTLSGVNLAAVTEVDFGAGRPGTGLQVTPTSVTVQSPPSPNGATATVPIIVRAGNDTLGLDGSLPFSYLSTAGYWMVASDGGIFTFGQLGYFGSMGGKPLAQPIVAMAATPDGGGYWMVASDGGIFAFGDAGYYGSMGGKPLAKPIVGMAATPDGGGYWLVASDGGIFAFGDAGYYGSMGGTSLVKPVVGMTTTPDGRGYRLVASDGGIFSFGDAGYYGSMGGKQLVQPIVGMTATADGGGYWLVASDGGIFAFGDAPFYGSMGSKPLVQPIVGMTATPDGGGYWMVASDGGIFAFGDAPFYGSMGGKPLAKPIVGMTAP